MLVRHITLFNVSHCGVFALDLFTCFSLLFLGMVRQVPASEEGVRVLNELAKVLGWRKYRIVDQALKLLKLVIDEVGTCDLEVVRKVIEFGKVQTQRSSAEIQVLFSKWLYYKYLTGELDKIIDKVLLRFYEYLVSTGEERVIRNGGGFLFVDIFDASSSLGVAPFELWATVHLGFLRMERTKFFGKETEFCLWLTEKGKERLKSLVGPRVDGSNIFM